MLSLAFFLITGLCNDTAVCGPHEFCSAAVTKNNESKWICRTGNITRSAMILFVVHNEQMTQNKQ